MGADVNRSPSLTEGLVDQGLSSPPALASEPQIGLLALALDQVADPVSIVDARGVIVWLNQAHSMQNGYSLTEAVGQTASILDSDQTVPQISGAMRDALRSGKAWRGEVVRRRKDGSTYEASLALQPLRGPDGATSHFVGTERDITAQVDTETALRRSEESFRTLIERSPDGIAVHRDGRFAYVNPAALSLLGYDHAHELVGRSVLEIVHARDREVVSKRMRTMMETGTAVTPLEERFVRRDGTELTVEVVALPLVFDGARAIAAIARDFTGRKQLAARLMQVDRMVAVGTLAAGVGHEINNPLAYVISNLEYLAQELPAITAPGRAEATMSAGASADLAEFKRALVEAREGAERIRNVVRDLKTFSRAETETRERVVLADVAELAIHMAWNEIRHRALLVKDFAPVPSVIANASRLNQVFLNLLVNAAQAIPEGHSEENAIEVRTFQEGAWVGLEVRDTGVGIPPENLSRIFDPFFTTKPIGQGTGLGLSICQGLVVALGGELHVTSTVGKGATFRVLLPMAGDEGARRQDPPVPSSRPVGRGRILVVDDEPLVGSAVRRILGDDHDVIVVDSGRAVLAGLEAGERFDVIFCDLMMPGITGMDLHAELVRRFPASAARMIFMTGGPFTARAQDFFDHAPNVCLEKPFDVQHVRELVRRVLESPPGASLQGSEGGPPSQTTR